MWTTNLVTVFLSKILCCTLWSAVKNSFSTYISYTPGGFFGLICSFDYYKMHECSIKNHPDLNQCLSLPFFARFGYLSGSHWASWKTINWRVMYMDGAPSSLAMHLTLDYHTFDLVIGNHFRNGFSRRWFVSASFRVIDLEISPLKEANIWG